MLDQKRPEASFKIIKKSWPKDNIPWKHTGAPIEIKAKGRRIPGWQKDEFNLVGLLSESPLNSKEPVEEITLIPMGAARLRISAFPVIDNGPDGQPWKTPPEPALRNPRDKKAAVKKKTTDKK